MASGSRRYEKATQRQGRLFSQRASFGTKSEGHKIKASSVSKLCPEKHRKRPPAGPRFRFASSPKILCSKAGLISALNGPAISLVAGSPTRTRAHSEAGISGRHAPVAEGWLFWKSGRSQALRGGGGRRVVGTEMAIFLSPVRLDAGPFGFSARHSILALYLRRGPSQRLASRQYTLRAATHVASPWAERSGSQLPLSAQ